MNKLTLFAIVAFGFVMQGCSTPPAGGSDDWYSEAREEAWSAYTSCLDQLEPYGRQAECDQVASNQQGYQQQGYQQQGYRQQSQQQGYYQPVYVQPPQQYYNQDPYYGVVPPYYIYSAQPSEVDAMTRQWIDLAEQPARGM